MSSNIPNYQPSTIETIDAAFLEYVEELNLFATTINGFEKVPVIWTSAERAYQIKNNREIRDKNGSLIPPIISIERINTIKDPTKKGNFQAGLSKGLDRYVYSQEINQEKTSNFANADTLRKTGQINFKTSKQNKKKVYKYISIPLPVYITVEYKINILTNYQSQMNEIIQPFMSRVVQNYFLIKKDGHRYECFMDQEFQQESISDLAEEERKYKASLTVKVLGYLIGEGNNQEKEQLNVKENPVEIKFPKENLFMVDEPKTQAKKRASNQANLVYSSLLTKKVFSIGDGVNSIYNVNHNFSTRDILVTIRENVAPFGVHLAAMDYTDIDNLSIDMGDVIGVDSYTVIILG